MGSSVLHVYFLNGGGVDDGSAITGSLRQRKRSRPFVHSLIEKVKSGAPVVHSFIGEVNNPPSIHSFTKYRDEWWESSFFALSIKTGRLFRVVSVIEKVTSGAVQCSPSVF